MMHKLHKRLCASQIDVVESRLHIRTSIRQRTSLLDFYRYHPHNSIKKIHILLLMYDEEILKWYLDN
jgi:hypothetical protein